MAFRAGNYFTDAAVARVVKVETDRFGNADFGWTAPAAGTPYTGYGTMRPRKVFGVDPLTGKGRGEIVPDIGANIWTGVATTFTVESPEGVEVTYNVTSRRGELIHLTR